MGGGEGPCFVELCEAVEEGEDVGEGGIEEGDDVRGVGSRLRERLVADEVPDEGLKA